MLRKNTDTDHVINTEAYWDHRFRSNWEERGGRAQSAFFADVALANVPHWFLLLVRQNRLEICDWGCALGDGSAALARAFPDSKVFGIDISGAAVGKAQELYPNVTFEQADISELNHEFDVIFTSNVLEHLTDPWLIVASVARCARKLCCILVPFKDDSGEDEHFYRFDYDNIRAHIAPDFYLVFAKIVDTSKIPNTHWGGYQAILVYARESFLEQIAPYGAEVASPSYSEKFILPNQAFAVERLAAAHLRAAGLSHQLAETQLQLFEQRQDAEAARRQRQDAEARATQLEDDLAQERSQLLAARQDRARAAELERELADTRARLTAVSLGQQLEDDLAQARSQLLAARQDRARAAELERELADTRARLDSQLQYRQQLEDDLAQARSQLLAARQDRARAAELERELADTRARLDSHLQYRHHLLISPRARILSDAVVRLEAHSGQLETQLRDIRSSHSWRVTRPLRVLSARLRGMDGPESPRLTPPALDRGVLQALIRDCDTTNVPVSLVYDFVRGLLRNGSRKGVVFITSAFEYRPEFNQRPISFAKEAAAQGYAVIFIAWQWFKDEMLERRMRIFEGSIIEVGRFEFLEAMDELGGLAADSDDAFFVLTIPSEDFVRRVPVIQKAGIKVVYDIMDDWEEFHRVGQAPWWTEQFEGLALRTTDVVTAVSPLLQQKFGRVRRDIEWVANGFRRAGLDSEPLVAMRNAAADGSIHLGYFGHLTDAWFDWAAIFDMLDQNPDFALDLIGYGEPEWATAEARLRPNLRLLGFRRPSELPQFVRTWHIGLIPFTNSPLSRAVDPIKVYEYLYLGLPTVATSIPHLSEYPETRSYPHLGQAVDGIRELYQRVLDGVCDYDAMLAFSRNATWPKRFQQVCAFLNPGSGTA